MGLFMAWPMVAWMRIRGHGRRQGFEMAALRTPATHPGRDCVLHGGAWDEHDRRRCFVNVGSKWSAQDDPAQVPPS